MSEAMFKGAGLAERSDMATDTVAGAGTTTFSSKVLQIGRCYEIYHAHSAGSALAGYWTVACPTGSVAVPVGGSQAFRFIAQGTSVTVTTVGTGNHVLTISQIG